MGVTAFNGHKLFSRYITDLTNSELDAIEAWYGADMPSIATFQLNLTCGSEGVKVES